MANSPSNHTTATPKQSSLSFLLGFYRPYAWRMGLALAFMIPTSGASLFFPKLTGNLVNTTINNIGSVDELYSIGLFFLTLLVAQAILGYIVSVTMARTTENVISKLRAKLYSHVIRLPMSVLTGKRVGELSSRFSSDITQIQETFSFSILQLIRQGILLVGSIVIILSTNVQLTLPILFGMPVIVAVGAVIGRRLRTLSTRTQDALAKSATIVEESLQSVAAVKSYVREANETTRYRDAISENVRLAVKSAKLRALLVTFILFVGFGGIAGVIIYGANLVSAKQVTIGDLMAFLMYAMFVGAALGSFVELYSQLQKTLGSAVRIQELLEVPEEDVTTSESPARLHDIVFDNVTFAYPERPDVNVITDVSFHISNGERIAFVGSSGAGKSTTASLVQRLYEPTGGNILYNGISSTSMSLGDVRSSVGIVPQDIVLFGGTIEENIRYGKLDATKDEISEAARDANALGFIEGFPEGFDTVVGERGIKLSGGQRQRIAIARALLKNPSILILDEATSALDAESESLIQQALDRLMKNRTVIIIAHRLSTVRTCDRIMVFENGSISQSGTHQQLIQAEGLYKKWCDMQFLT